MVWEKQRVVGDAMATSSSDSYPNRHRNRPNDSSTIPRASYERYRECLEYPAYHMSMAAHPAVSRSTPNGLQCAQYVKQEASMKPSLKMVDWLG